MLWDGNIRKPARVAESAEITPNASAKKNNLVRKTFSILRAFQHPDEWLTSQELSRRARMPARSVATVASPLALVAKGAAVSAAVSAC